MCASLLCVCCVAAACCGGGVCGSVTWIGAEGARHLAEAFKSCPQLQSVNVGGGCGQSCGFLPTIGWLQLLCALCVG